MPATPVDTEEAAARLGVSTETVRHWCRSGVLSAAKIGSQWTIDAASISKQAAKLTRTRARRPPTKMDFNQAVIQITGELGLQFVPDLLRLSDYRQDRSGVEKEASTLVANKSDLPVGRLFPVEAPKDELAIRPGSILDPMDWIVYHAAIARIADAADLTLGTNVYSSRVDRQSNKRLTRPFAKQYAAWQRKSRNLLESGKYSYLLTTDIVAYYEHVDIDKLHKVVKPIDAGAISWPIINTMLRDWQKDIRGIPQGPEASAILGNLYLTPIDSMLAGRPGVEFLRYMDDIRVFSNDRSELVRTAWEMQRVARALGLDLKTSKTDIKPASEAVATITNSDMDIATYLMDVDQPQARRVLRKMVRTAIRRAHEPDRRSFEFGLRRLSTLGDANLLGEVLTNLDRLAASGPVIAKFAAQFPNKQLVVDDITEFVCDPDRSLWPLYEMWLLLAVARTNLGHPPKLNHRCRQILSDNGQPWWLRSAALDVVARDAHDPINQAAIDNAIRANTELPFFRHAAAILNQRSLPSKVLASEAKKFARADRLVSYVDSTPKAVKRFL